MYNNPVPVAVGIVPVYGDDQTEHFLFIRRAVAPIGGVACVSGYVDEGESAEQAMAREFMEEVGAETLPEDWQVFATRCTPSNRLLIFMKLVNLCVHIDDLDGFVPNSEVSEVIVGDRHTELVFPLQSEILSKLP